MQSQSGDPAAKFDPARTSPPSDIHETNAKDAVYTHCMTLHARVPFV